MHPLVEQRTCGQLPEPRRQQIERRRRRRSRLPARPRQRQHGERRQQPTRPRPALTPAQPHEEQQREDQVELLFHTQRPGMQERIEFSAGREVIVLLAGQHDVAQADQRGPAGLVELLIAPRAGNKQRRQHEGRHQHHQQRRQQAQHATPVEIEQHRTQRCLGARGQRLADHEAGYHEEQVHTGEAAGQPRRVDVEKDDGQHRQCTQAIDGGVVGTFGRGHAGNRQKTGRQHRHRLRSHSMDNRDRRGQRSGPVPDRRGCRAEPCSAALRPDRSEPSIGSAPQQQLGVRAHCLGNGIRPRRRRTYQAMRRPSWPPTLR